jgi:hypothetical protein
MQFKKKVTLSHIYNEVTSEPTITRYTKIENTEQYSIQNAFCCGVAILQHGLLWRRRPETLSRVNYKQALTALKTTVVYHVIVDSLVTSLQTCESVTFFLNCPVRFAICIPGVLKRNL